MLAAGRAARHRVTFLAAVSAGEFEHVTITAGDLARMAELVRTYADLPLGAVNASVVAVAERLGLGDVATWTGGTSLSSVPNTPPC